MTNLNFQHKPKYIMFQKFSCKNRPITYGLKSIKLATIILYNESKHKYPYCLGRQGQQIIHSTTKSSNRSILPIRLIDCPSTYFHLPKTRKPQIQSYQQRLGGWVHSCFQFSTNIIAIKHMVETLERSYWAFNIVGGVLPIWEI